MYNFLMKTVNDGKWKDYRYNDIKNIFRTDILSKFIFNLHKALRT